jgi:hypothetical protein
VNQKYDVLLEFLSEKGRGTWGELKDAFDWIWGPSEDPAEQAWIAARDLAALGHIEIAWDQKASTWCAAPPLLTTLPRSGGRSFLTGARTRFLMRTVEVAAERLGLWIDRCGSQRGPTTFLIACGSHEDAENLASELGIGYTYSVADQLSALLPPLDRYMDMFTAGELPAGFEPERFEPATLTWEAVTDTNQRGLYRTRAFHGQVHALLDAASRWRRVAREFAVYEVLRWEVRGVIGYDEERAQLRVPIAAALPALHARAASICDGRLPRFERHSGGGLVYDNIPRKVAERIASSLCQELISNA